MCEELGIEAGKWGIIWKQQGRSRRTKNALIPDIIHLIISCGINTVKFYSVFIFKDRAHEWLRIRQSQVEVGYMKEPRNTCVRVEGEWILLQPGGRREWRAVKPLPGVPAIQMEANAGMQGNPQCG